MTKDIRNYHWLYALIIASAALIGLHVIGSNNPGHMDEYDYLFVGKNLLDGNEWPSLTYIFGAEFNWYLLGVGDRYFGGLSGARIIATIFGVLSLIVTYLFTLKVWQSRSTAILAVFLFGISAPHVFISHFATYDIVSFTLFVLSLYVLYLCCNNIGVKQYILLVTGVLLFAAAVLSKYVVLIYIPLVGIILLVYATRVAMLACVLLSCILGSYVLLNIDDLRVLYVNQITGVHGANASRVDIIRLLLPYLAIPIVLWCLGVVKILRGSCHNKRERILLFVMFMVLAIPLPLYHIHSENMISLYKHVVYALFFLAPTSAWLILQYAPSAFELHSKRTYALGSLLLIMVIFSSYKIHLMQTGYPDSNPMVSKVLPLIHENSTILSEDPYIFRYSFFDTLPQSQIREIGWLDYNGDNNYGPADVRQALTEKFYDIVLINDQIHPIQNSSYRDILINQGYTLIYSEPYSLSKAITKNQSGEISLFINDQDLPSVTQSTF